jgi:hypothetical protein
MTTNLRICLKNAVDDSRAVLTCSVSDILTVYNLQNIARGRILRVAAADGIEVRCTYGGEAVRATMIGLIGHNIDPGIGATFRFQGYSAADLTGLVIDTGPRDAVPSGTLDYLDFGIGALGASLFDPTSRRKQLEVWFDDGAMAVYDGTEVILSWKLTINAAANSGDIDLSRLWVGKHFELDSNPIYGAGFGWIDESQSWRTDGGGAHTDAVVPYRGGKFDMQNFPESNRAMWADAARSCGAGRRPFYLSLEPDNAVPARTIFYSGEFIFKNPLPQLTFVDTNGGAHNTTITIEET